MRTQQVLARIIALVLVLLAFVACGAPIQEAIIGTWKMQGQEETMEFQEDGTVVSTKDGEVLYTGRYTFVDENHVTISLEPDNPDDPPSIATFEVEIRANQMNIIQMTDTGIRMGIYTRVP